MNSHFLGLLHLAQAFSQKGQNVWFFLFYIMTLEPYENQNLNIYIIYLTTLRILENFENIPVNETS